MSLCQSKGSSCGACCGLFNLDYPPAVLKRILEERTTIFSEKVDYAKRETVIFLEKSWNKKKTLILKKMELFIIVPF